jgi:hypothetical protein
MLQRLAQVFQQMPTVGGLEGFGRAGAGCLGVGGAVAGDDLHVRMFVEPFLNGGGFAIGQQIEDSSAFQINDEGAKQENPENVPDGHSGNHPRPMVNCARFDVRSPLGSQSGANRPDKLGRWRTTADFRIRHNACTMDRIG